MARGRLLSRPGLHRTAVALATVVAVSAVAVAAWPARTPVNVLVAHFAATVGIHEGSDVRVLGVPIGEVVRVRPEGRTVRVEMRYDGTRPIPRDVRAVVIPPSVVSDRYIQLTPAYAGGPVLANNADLPLDRTAVPLELDDIYRSLDELNRALGPNGANNKGALSDLIGTGAANLDGSGADLGATLDGFATTLDTLAAGRDDLFGALVDLQKFVTTVAESDAQVRRFNDQLAAVSEQLAGEGDELAAALRALSLALADITAFVRDNRAALKSNVEALTGITGVLVRQQKALIQVLDVAPLALSNLNLTYNARSGTLDTRNNAMGPYDPASFVCSLMVDLVPLNQVPQECFALAQTLKDGRLPMTNQLRKLLGLQPVAPSSAGDDGGGLDLPAVPGLPDGSDSDDTSADPTLGGILKGVL